MFFEACGIETFDYVGLCFVCQAMINGFVGVGAFHDGIGGIDDDLAADIAHLIDDFKYNGRWSGNQYYLCLLYCIRYGMHGCIVVLKRVLAFEILDIVGAQ